MSRVPDNEELEDYQELKVNRNGLQAPQNGISNHNDSLPEANGLHNLIRNANKEDESILNQTLETDESTNSNAQSYKTFERKRVRTSMEGMRGIICAIAHLPEKDNL